MPQGSRNNSASGVLSSLAQSPHSLVQLATVALVALSGLGNWVATTNSGERNKAEIELNRAVAAQSEARLKAVLVQQVAEIHAWLTDATAEFHQGNADSAANRKTLLEVVGAQQSNIDAFEARVTNLLANQSSMLKNQSDLLAGQTKMLEALHKDASSHP